jgi:excisionase family DNA binding protein
MAEREISVAEAARKLGVSLTYLYSLLWTGKLKARKVNRQWRISADAVAARLKARGE